jgi:hypothetical protein
MWAIILDQLESDMKAVIANEAGGRHEPVSLLAKWMPTETASSIKTRVLAKKAMKALRLTPRMYRKILSRLRAYLRVVESSMSKGEWDAIEYGMVPSYAMKNYKEAFAKHDPVGFSAYKASLVRGEAKVNASTLYPYDLVREYLDCYRIYRPNTITEAQWKELPNYVSGENNILIMADVSGSMWGRPMETSIGLATYFAQHNTGPYHNLYMTFSSTPSFIELREGATLAECVNQVRKTSIGLSTNLEKAFETILRHAITNRVSPDAMPKALVVISDMEIDRYMRQNKMDFVDAMRVQFEQFGYQLPKLVLWNVEARNDTFLSKQDDVLLVSGQSVSTFKLLCNNLDDKKSWEMMMEALNDPMYDCVAI